MDESKVYSFLYYFKSRKIKEEKFMHIIESLCEGASYKGKSYEHIHFYTRKLPSRGVHIFQWNDYLFSP